MVLRDINAKMVENKKNEDKLLALKKSKHLDRMVFNFLQELSIIGFRYCFDKSRPSLRRVMWAVFILLGIGIATYQIKDRIALYNSYSTTTDINMINTDAMEFPQVTICNENAARMSVAKKYGIVAMLTALYPPLSKASISEEINWNNIPVPNKTRNEWEKIRKELAQPFEEAYYMCSWGSKPCSPSLFRTVQTNMGQCFAIVASDYNFTATRAGSFYGLTLGLFANQYEYLGTSSPSAGFRLLLHEPSEFPLMQESAVKLSPGFITSISVTFSSTTRQPPPYGICRDDPNYRQTDCIMKCEAQYVFNNCGCKFFYSPDFEAPICDFVELYKCGQKALSTYNGDLTNGSKNCYCPPQCKSKSYQLSLSQNIFSNRFTTIVSNFSQEHNMSLPVTLSKQVIMENYVAVQIYYSTMQYLSITTNPGYSFMGLLSDIGGALGLLLGATLLTFIELAEFGWEMVTFWYVTRFLSNEEEKDAEVQIHQVHQVKNKKKIVPMVS